MTQMYLPRFKELFLDLTGLDAEKAQVGEDGWLFVPYDANLAEKGHSEREILSVLGWRNHHVDNEYAGWWVKPWKNLEAGTYTALTLSEEGARSFRYLQAGKPGQRHVYYIAKINTGVITGAPMLLGQFVFEFEGCPETALRMTPGGTNRIYYPHDSRISAYDSLTPQEVLDTKERLAKLFDEYPADVTRRVELAVSKIPELMQAL